MKTEDHNTTSPLTDNDIRLMMKKLPSGPHNPWLIKKVMNRLPEPTSTRHSWPVLLTYILAAVILFAGWIFVAINIMSPATNAVTYSDIIYTIILISMTIALPLSYQNT